MFENIYDRRSLHTVERQCYDLYDKIKTKIVPDIIIGIARGGWIPARLICDRFSRAGDAYQNEKGEWKIPITYPHLFNIGMRRYGTLEGGEIEWYQPLGEEARADIQGKDVLVIDDVLDAGLSLAAIVRHIKDAGPKNLFAGVVDIKKEPFSPTPELKKKVQAERDEAMRIINECTENNFFYGNEVEGNVWILYPWEAKEGSLEVYKRFGEEDFVKSLPVKGDVRERIEEGLRPEFEKIDKEKVHIAKE